MRRRGFLGLFVAGVAVAAIQLPLAPAVLGVDHCAVKWWRFTDSQGRETFVPYFE